MMKRNPAGAARSVEQRIKNRPVGYGIRSVFHAFCFPKRRSHGSGVEMIAPNRNWRSQIAALHQFIDSFAHFGTLAVAEPADARGQALELHPITRETQPAIQG